jgi:hypothetical protein
VAVALARKLLGTDVTLHALAALDPVDGPRNGNPIAKDSVSGRHLHYRGGKGQVDQLYASGTKVEDT